MPPWGLQGSVVILGDGVTVGVLVFPPESVEVGTAVGWALVAAAVGVGSCDVFVGAGVFGMGVVLGFPAQIIPRS